FVLNIVIESNPAMRCDGVCRVGKIVCGELSAIYKVPNSGKPEFGRHGAQLDLPKRIDRSARLCPPYGPVAGTPLHPSAREAHHGDWARSEDPCAHRFQLRENGACCAYFRTTRRHSAPSITPI